MTDYLLYEDANASVHLDPFSPAAHHPQPGLRIEISGESFPDFEPTHIVSRDIVNTVFNERKEMSACEIVLKLYQEHRKEWDPDTRHAAELFVGEDNAEAVRRDNAM